VGRLLTAPRGGPLLLLAVLAAGLPLVLTNSFHLNVATNVGLAAIACVGLNLLIGYAGQVSLGHAAFFGLGAYASAVLSTSHGWPPLLALAAGLAGTGLLAFLVAWPVLRLRGHYLAMATLGLGIIVSIALNQEAWLTGGPDGMAVAAFAVAPGLALRDARAWCWLVGGLLVAVTWLALNLVDSPTGRALKALHASEVAAEVAGVDTRRHKVLAFVLSALLASLAGSLYAHFAGWLTPDEADFLRSIELVAMVVLGGMASVYGAIVGAAILTSLPQLLTVFHDYEQVVLGLVLMLTMILLPRGLVPTLVRAAPWGRDR
jgi:branched-chain amino acid transport system permease protein